MATDGESKKSKSTFKPNEWLEMETKGNLKDTAIKTGTQFGAGVVGGAVLTAVMGKWSFLPALILMSAGNYADKPVISTLGTGMAASSLTLAVDDALNGAEGFDLKTEAGKAKQRLINLKDAFMSRTYLSKVFAKKEKKDEKKTQRKVSGGEELPEEMNGLNEPGMTELENVEKQLIAEAIAFQKKQRGKQMEGIDPDLMGLEAEVDFSTM